MKIFLIVAVGFLLIASFIYLKYKPLYKVTLNGKVIGYVEDKGKMQEKMLIACYPLANDGKQML